MIAPKTISEAWEELRSTEDTAILHNKLSEAGHEYSIESIRKWLVPGASMPDFAFHIFSDYYADKAVKVKEQVAKFKKLMGR